MAEEMALQGEEVKEDKKARKERLKAEKKAKKEAKKKAKENGEDFDDEEAEERLGSRLVLVFVTLLIIVIWLAIICVLIKSDVGGFGSSVLYPVLKDVPYINKILPSQDTGAGGSTQGSDTEYGYDSIDSAVAKIKELEEELNSSKTQNEKDAETITELQNEIEDLSTYKEQEAAFEEEKEKFYEEVVFSDEAPDISQYKSYYESIEPKNAEILYKQVVEQITADEEMDEYVKTYTSMQAKNAAAIFDTMTDNLSLVADILNNMGTTQRADILSKMDTDTAAKLTKMMNPSD